MNENKDFLFYRSEDGSTSIQIATDGKTVWATQAKMAEIFDVSKFLCLAEIPDECYAFLALSSII